MRPDFSGEWVLNRAASSLSPGADAVASGVWKIDHREPTLRQRATLVFSGGQSFSYEYSIRADGAEVIGSERGMKAVATLTWDGPALLFVTRTAGSDGETTVS